MLLVDGRIPEYDTHVVALRLAEGEDKSIREVAPHVVGLDICEEDIGVDGKRDT